MAYRVATSMKTSTHQNYLRQLEVKKLALSNKISGGTKQLSLADDPSASALAVKYQSDLTGISSYIENTEAIRMENNRVHDDFSHMNEVVRDIQELTVQAAHGTYNQDDLKLMAANLDQKIQTLIDVANSKDENGDALYAGTDKIGEAFEQYMGRVPGGDGPMVVKVDYVGNQHQTEVAIDAGTKVEVNRAGSRLFWGSPESIYSRVDASEYRVLQDSNIFINGQEIALNAGDNIHAIVARINSATVAVNADTMDNSLRLDGNRSEQLVLEDGPGSTTLSDLGLIVDGSPPPHNISPYADRNGGNIFNQLIDVRNMMLKGDQQSLGGRGLATVSQITNSMTGQQSSISAQSARLTAASSVLESRHQNIAEAQSEEALTQDMDIIEMRLEQQALDTVHTATLQSAAKALRPSLLDFLR